MQPTTYVFFWNIKFFVLPFSKANLDWPFYQTTSLFIHPWKVIKNYTILSKIYKASKTGVLINKNKQSPLEHLSIKAPLFDSLIFPHTYFQIYQLWFNYVIKFARHACVLLCVQFREELCRKCRCAFWQRFSEKIFKFNSFCNSCWLTNSIIQNSYKW